MSCSLAVKCTSASLSLKPGDGQDWHCVVLLEERSKDGLLVAAKCLGTCLVQ
jgi:hypothetical protein